MKIILLAFHLALLFHQAVTSKVSSELIEFLEADGIISAVPVVNRSDAIHVTLSIELMQIQEIHDTEQQMTAKYWVRMSWKNQLTTWKPEDWDGVKDVPIDSNHVWTPDIVLYNSGGAEFSGGPSKYPFPVVVEYDGTTRWLSPATFTSSCRLHFEFFPLGECFGG